MRIKPLQFPYVGIYNWRYNQHIIGMFRFSAWAYCGIATGFRSGVVYRLSNPIRNRNTVGPQGGNILGGRSLEITSCLLASYRLLKVWAPPGSLFACQELYVVNQQHIYVRYLLRKPSGVILVAVINSLVNCSLDTYITSIAGLRSI